MYLNNAIDRINKIDWNQSGLSINEQADYLGYEYLRRIAGFIKEQALEPTKSICINVASILGDEGEGNYIEYCSVEVQDCVKNKFLAKYILNCYLQLANFVDNNRNAESYMQIYEPMIQLLERGFNFDIREGGLMVYNVGFYPLGGWYERFLKATPKEI